MIMILVTVKTSLLPFANPLGSLCPLPLLGQTLLLQAGDALGRRNRADIACGQHMRMLVALVALARTRAGYLPRTTNVPS